LAALHPGKSKDIEKIRIHKCRLLIKTFIFVSKKKVVLAVSRGLLDFGIFPFQYRGKGPRTGTCPSALDIEGCSVDFLLIFVELVKAQLVLHPEENEHAAGYADSKACNVDKRVTFVFFYDPERDFKIVFYHGETPINIRFEKRKKGDQDLVPDPGLGPEFFALRTDVFVILFDITDQG
jgi:hypothetical protein